MVDDPGGWEILEDGRGKYLLGWEIPNAVTGFRYRKVGGKLKELLLSRIFPAERIEEAKQKPWSVIS